MDPSAMPLTVPTSTDNQTVILWVVAVLVVVAGYLFRQLSQRQAEAEALCRAENERARATVESAYAKIEALQSGAIAEAQRSAVQITAAMDKVADVIDRNTQALRDVGIGSGRHSTRET